MTVHQCPKCELKFAWKTEVDDHCWHDHPEFRHEYPAHRLPPPEPPTPVMAPAPHAEHHTDAKEFVGWLVPPKPHH